MVTERPRLGATATSRAFGATVHATFDAPGLCFVVARRSVGQAVAAAGGRLVADLGRDRALALLDVEGLGALKAHPDVSVVGGVAVDRERFARFCALTGGGTSDN